ncbi:hypothetical protein B0J14DRAFT_582903 [Halenospora varia]|nr:hypothetical protein B0J14DRAFT_582903 [Halenospora varia]
MGDFFRRLRNGRAFVDFFQTACEETPQTESQMDGSAPEVVSHPPPHTRIEASHPQSESRRASIQSFNNIDQHQNGEDYDLSENIQQDEQPESQGPLPISSHYLHMITTSDDYGEPTAALILTETLMWQMNKLIHWEAKSDRYTEKINYLRSQVDGVGPGMAEVDRQLAEMQEGQDTSAQLQWKETVGATVKSFEEQIKVLETKLKEGEDDIRRIRKRAINDVGNAMVRANLRDAPEADSEAGGANPATNEEEQTQTQNQRRPPTPTPSQIADWELADAQDAARKHVTDMTIALQDAQEKVDKWEQHYDRELGYYLEAVEGGQCSDTRSDFDINLLLGQRLATRELIQAEENFLAAKRHAYSLGVMLLDIDQTSQFPDFEDDGYGLSIERDMVVHCDWARIEKWRDNVPSEEGEQNISPSVEVDVWDNRDVEMGDSISCIAEGPERTRIDRWYDAGEVTVEEMELAQDMVFAEGYGPEYDD